jgi:DNA-binding NarL/FixJ family response regulator
MPTLNFAPPTTSAQKTARVIIVEDYPVVRDALAQMLNATPGFSVVAAVGDVNGARESVKREKPDVLVLDLMLGGTDALGLITELSEAQPTLKILVLSMMSEVIYAERALRAGAIGYVMKTAETAEVVNALKSVLDGRVYLSPRIFVGMFRGLLKRSPKHSLPGTEGLSDRELQIFQLIGASIPNRDIATQLGISVKTVETHRENLKNKLGIQDGHDLKDAASFFVNSLVA